MKIRWLLVALLSAALAVAAACSGDDDSPFKGSWIAETGLRITFTNDTWTDSEGDSGSYTYTGEDPVYTLTMETATRRITKRATFIDANTIEFCTVSSSGAVGSCVNLVIDRPTLH